MALVTDELDAESHRGRASSSPRLSVPTSSTWIWWTWATCSANFSRVLAPRSWLLEGERRGSLPADRQRLTEALMELATNAIRHTKADDVIALGAEVEGSEASFWVRDQGIGIAPADQATLFERFQRGGTGRRADGAGLGLSIVRAIAQAHGGRAEVQSAPGRALFTMCAGGIAGGSRPPGETSDAHLMVEDEER